MNTNRWKNYGLWVAIASFIPLVLSAFGIQIVPNYQELVNGLLSILVLAGIVSNPTTTSRGFLDDPQPEQPPTNEDPKK